MKKLLIICGSSGSGKSFIESELLKNEANCEYTFEKLPQITTRAKRTENEDSYTFLTLHEYIKEIITNKYFGRIRIDNKFGEPHYYATKMTDHFMNFCFDKTIYTAIENLDGIMDIERVLSENELYKRLIEVYVLMIDCEDAIEKRSDRTKSYVDNERYLLFNSNPYPIHILKNNFRQNKLITAEEVIDRLKSDSFI